MKRFLMAAGAAATLLCSTAANAEWVRAWHAAPQDIMGSDRAKMPTLKGVMLQQIIRVGASGTKIRIRFANDVGNSPVKLGMIRIVRVSESGTLDQASARLVKLAGLVDGAIPSKGTVTSEPIDLPVKALDRLLVAIQVPELVERPTVHRAAMAETVLTLMSGATANPDPAVPPPADPTAPVKPRTPINPTEGMPTKHGMRYFITSLEVDAPAGSKTIVAIGDSITDGIDSTPNADRRWPDVLQKRIIEAKLPFAVVNAGISGNRLLKGGTGGTLLSRFSREALEAPGVSHIIVLIGVNDIANGGPDGAPPPTGAAVIEGYKQLISKAHAKNLKIIAGTITPYKGAKNWTDDGEKARTEINAWIRTPGNFDGVIDFDKAVRDPANPAQMLAANEKKNSWVHPNDAGYAAMGAAVDLALFKK